MVPKVTEGDHSVQGCASGTAQTVEMCDLKIFAGCLQAQQKAALNVPAPAPFLECAIELCVRLCILATECQCSGCWHDASLQVQIHHDR